MLDHESTTILVGAPLLLILIGSSAACNSDERAAKGTAVEYIDAIQTGQWETARSLVSSEDRAAMPLDERGHPLQFTGWTSENIEDLRKREIGDSHNLMTPFGSFAGGLACLTLTTEAARKQYAHVRYIVVSTSVQDDHARVVLDFSADGASPKTQRETLKLVQQSKKWRVDTMWAEHKAKADREEKLFEAKQTKLREANYLFFTARDSKAAKVKLDELLVLDPGNDPAHSLLTYVNEDLQRIVAGQWRMESRSDPMTDRTWLALSLWDEAEPEERRLLVVRCKEKHMALFVNVGEVLDGNLYGVYGRIRLGDAPAQAIRFNEGSGSSPNTIFFPDAEKWLQMFIAHPASELLIEVPVYAHGLRILKFNLRGADVVLPKSLDACKPSKKTSRRNPSNLLDECAWGQRDRYGVCTAQPLKTPTAPPSTVSD